MRSAANMRFPISKIFGIAALVGGVIIGPALKRASVLAEENCEKLYADYLQKAKDFVKGIAEKNGMILFVCSKNEAQEAIRKAAAPLKTQDSALDVSGTERDALVDTCGTGGDASGTCSPLD